MIRYAVAHWRGALSPLTSFLVNGVLGYLLISCLVLGVGAILGDRAFLYVGMSIWAAWFIWATVGIFRCCLRVLREPGAGTGRHRLRRALSALALLATAAFVVNVLGDVGLFVL